jgi:hypothetical protein
MEEVWHAADDDYERQESDVNPDADPQDPRIAANYAFSMVNTALSVLFNRTPSYILKPQSSRYTGNTALMKALLNDSVEKSNSAIQYELFEYNREKYGFAVGRTFNRKSEGMKKFRKETEREVDEEGQVIEKDSFDERLVTEYDEIYFQNISPYNAWIDGAAVPGDMLSIQDWMWKEVWTMDRLLRTFPEKEFPNIKHVKERSNLSKIHENRSETNDIKDSDIIIGDDQVDIFFYENRILDRFIVEANGVMLVWEPLPQDHKRLSLSYGWWLLRSSETIYGIGIPEAIRGDNKLLDWFRNASFVELMYAIHPTGFYGGPEELTDDDVRLRPGQWKRKNLATQIDFVTRPGARPEVLNREEVLVQSMERKSGVTRTVQGEELGKTATEAAFNREAALKRLTKPLQYLQWSLSNEAKNRLDLIKQTYSVPKVERLADPKDIEDYVREVEADEEFYFIKQTDEGEPNEFFTRRFRTINTNIKQDDDGNFIETDDEKFFNIRPEGLIWEGDVNVKKESILIESDELRKVDMINLVNTLVPLLQAPPETSGKLARNIVLKFNEEPRDWLPDAFLGNEQQAIGVPGENLSQIAAGIIGGGEQGATGGGQTGNVQTPQDVLTQLGSNVSLEQGARGR